MTSLLGVIVFLAKVTDLKTSFSKNLVSNACIWGTCARCVCNRGICSGDTCTRAASTRSVCTGSSCAIDACTKSAYTKGACIEDTCLGDANTRDTCIEGTYMRGAYMEDICIKSTYITGPCARGIWIGNTCTYAFGTYIRAWVACGTSIYNWNACVDNVSAVKRSEIHLQFFWNLKVWGARLDIQVKVGYAYIKDGCFCHNRLIRLEIRVEASCTYIGSACFCQNIEVRDSRLEIQVEGCWIKRELWACCINNSCFQSWMFFDP